MRSTLTFCLLLATACGPADRPGADATRVPTADGDGIGAVDVDGGDPGGDGTGGDSQPSGDEDGPVIGTACEVDGTAGTCLPLDECPADGYLATPGFCAGANDVQCCTPRPATEITCDVQGIAGVCIDTADCGDGYVARPGHCPGPTTIQCCIPDDVVPCEVYGVAGECLDVAECDGGRVATAGFCPGPSNIQCCHEPTADACDPTAQPTPNSGLGEDPGDTGCAPGMARVDDFCVDRYEAALVEVHADGSVSSWSPYFNPGSHRVRALSVAGAVPQGYISGKQAALACAEAGKRLCTDVEWLRACRGPSSWTYPYGNTREPGVCNDYRYPHPVVEYFGTTDSWIWSELDHPCINQQHDTVDRTGENSGCVSYDGLFDMMGNLHEWTADPNGTFRGGYYVDTTLNGDGCLYRTTAHNTDHWDYSTGFRCCADLAQ